MEVFGKILKKLFHANVFDSTKGTYLQFVVGSTSLLYIRF